jgi:hypothetical protein
MDAIGTGLLVLTSLNAVVWWRVWQQWRPQGPRWTQDQPPQVDVDTHVAAPCVLCRDTRHTAQEHIRLPQWELAGRDAHPDTLGAGP